MSAFLCSILESFANKFGENLHYLSYVRQIYDTLLYIQI